MNKKIFLISFVALLSLTGCVEFDKSSHKTGEGSIIYYSSFSVPVSPISPMSIPTGSAISTITMKHDSLKGIVPINQTEIKEWMKEEPQIISTLGAYDNVTLAPYQAGVNGGLMLGASYTGFSYIDFTTNLDVKGMIIVAHPGFTTSSENPDEQEGFYCDSNVMIGLNDFGFIPLEDGFKKPSEIKNTNCPFNFEKTPTKSFRIIVNNRRAIIEKVIFY